MNTGTVVYRNRLAAVGDRFETGATLYNCLGVHPQLNCCGEGRRYRKPKMFADERRNNLGFTSAPGDFKR
jgi:hypothetical protein